MKKLSKVWKWLLGVLGLLLLFVLGLFIPWGSWGLSSHPNPSDSYEEAVRRIKIIQAAEETGFNPVCKARFMTHGQKTQRVIILVHGYTNCTQQFAELGKRFYDAGDNVLILNLPHHGLADRMTEAHALLTAEELTLYADQTVDIAQGLGDKVVMMGLSFGGVTTAWAAQNRSDLDLAVIISPAFGFKQIPTPLTAVAMNAYGLLPDEFVWWDPDLKGDAPPPHAYPRYSKHTLVQSLRLGFALKASASAAAPAAKKIIMVYNANDTSVNNELTAQYAAIWQAHGANLSAYEFPLELQLGHDLIDPSQPDQQIDLVYPKLMELVNQ